MHKLFSIIIITGVTLCASSAKASINDCINQLIPFGISHDRAEKACSKACVSGDNKILQSELNRLCQAAKTGNGETIYYSNGRTMTSFAGQKGATWYYPNGRTMTSFAGREGATWYYSNGRTMTSFAGRKGATWYYSNGRTMTSFAGREGATWYHSDGSVITSSGNLMSSEEMLYPCSYIE